MANGGTLLNGKCALSPIAISAARPPISPADADAAFYPYPLPSTADMLLFQLFSPPYLQLFLLFPSPTEAAVPIACISLQLLPIVHMFVCDS